ncbi:MAG: domain S-box protein [Segetibacter sp.]|nr:domain S-box protein [Segetibacter sp.]
MKKYPEFSNTKLNGFSKKSRIATGDDRLHHLAFDNSFQANIIIAVSSGKIITANNAACNLLGYTKEELVTKNRADIFDINESSFKKMLKQRTAEGQSAALVNVIQKSGSQLVCEITSAVFMDEDGIEKSITTVADMSQSILKQKNINIINEKKVSDNIVLARSNQKKIDTKKEKIVADNIVLAKLKQKNIDAKKEKIVADNIILAQTESDARLVENNEWIKHIATTSYDVMWDWDVATGHIYAGDSLEEVFGYKVQNNNTVNFAHFSRCLLPEEKDTVEKKLLETLDSADKSWNDAFMFKRQDGSVASTKSRASIIRDKSGKAIRLIGAIQDVSSLQQLEKKLEEQITIQEENSETFFLAAKLSSDVIWDWNLLTDEMFIGEGFEELFGYDIKNNNGKIPISQWENYLHPNDKEAVEKGLHDAIASSTANWESAYRFIRSDGSIAKVFNRAGIFRNADGKAFRMIGALQDITERKKTEREKELVIKELMKSNADLKQFSYITSHNLRAPLSNIQSILSIIDYSTLDKANEEMLKLLNISGKQLSKTINDLTEILVIKNNVNAEIRTIHLQDAFSNMNKIFSVALNDADAKVFTDFKDAEIDFNETYFESILINLFSNAIKYRSPKRSLVIRASSKNENNGNTIFRFSDNGTGIDIDRHKDRLFGLYQRFHNSIEGQGLGLYIIKSQIEALNGTIEIESTLNKGTTFIITFKTDLQ